MGYPEEPPGTSEESTTRRKVLIGATGVAVGLAGCTGNGDGDDGGGDGSGGGDSGSDSGSGDGDSGGNAEQEQPSGTRWYDSDTEIGVMEGVEAEIDSIGSMYIRGVVENFSDSDYDYVQLEFEVYDETEAKIADGLANTSGLSSGQRWRFEALAPNADGADSYILSDITAY